MSDLALPAVRPASATRDGLTMVGRNVRLTFRSMEALLMAVALPVMLMLTFVYLFGGAIDTGGGKYVTYVVPGVILLVVGFASGQTAVGVATDIRGGIIDRFRSLDVSGPALLTGHVVASVLRNALATAVVLGVAFAIGFRPSAGLGDWLAAAAILLAFITAISWVAAALGLLAGNPEAASGFSFFVSFLPYPSSAFVPVDSMPSWLQVVARNQPVTPVIESVRGLLLDLPVGTYAWQALAWCAGIVAVSVAASAILFRRRVS